MISVLGLRLEKAEAILKANGIEDIQTEYVFAPRGEHTRGTLRVVKQAENGKKLYVAYFEDDILEKEGTENEA